MTDPLSSEQRKAKFDRGGVNTMTIFSGVTVICMLFTLPAYGAWGPMQSAICMVVQELWGPLGVGMATLGVCAAGGAAALGKGSWGMAITVIGGMGLMMGAHGIADSLGIGGQCWNGDP